MIRFSKFIWLYILISSLVLIPGIYSLVRYGLRPSIDFSGGTLLAIQLSTQNAEDVLRQVAKEQNLSISSIQKSQKQSYFLRLKPTDSAVMEQYTVQIASRSGEKPVVLRNETVGHVLGKELLQKTFTASILAMVAILLYVAYAFKNVKYGVSAIIALIHDLFVVIGMFSLFGVLLGVEIDTLFLTAILTTMSFSVHDTIVVFDRIRELQKTQGRTSFEDMSDRALTETVGRSLTNSMTIIFMLLALVLVGGESIKWFAVALLIGTISGTYSSPFIATPILIFWQRWEKKKHIQAK